MIKKFKAFFMGFLSSLISFWNSEQGKQMAAWDGTFAFLVWISCFVKFVSLDKVIRVSPWPLPLTLAAMFTTTGLLILWTLFLPQRWRKRILIYVDLSLSILICIDLLSYRYYSDLFSFHNLGAGGQIAEIWASIVALMHPSDFLLFADLPLLSSLRKRAQDARLAPSFRFRNVVLIGIMSFCALVTGARFYLFNEACPGVLSIMWDKVAVSMSIGAVNYHVVDAAEWLDGLLFSSRASAGDSEGSVIQCFKEENTKKAEEPRLYRGSERGRNVIYIQVESLQNFVIGRRVNGQEITPNLNRLARQSLYFSNCYHQTAFGNTSDAEFLTNTSLYPEAKGSVYLLDAKDTFNSMGTILRAHGYDTAVFHANRPNFWNRNKMYKALGFNHFYNSNDFKEDEVIGLGLSDGSFFRQSLPTLERMQQPFYAMLITLSSHFPFQLDSWVPDDLDVGSLKGTLLGNYLESIHYTDRQIGLFIEDLKKAGLWDNSIVVLYGDHIAIPLANKADLLKFVGKENQSDDVTWKNLQEIPLFIHLPHDAHHQVVSHPVGQIDVAPTVLNLLGFSMPTALGEDLLNTKTPLVVFRHSDFIWGHVWYTPENDTVLDLQTGRPLPKEPYLKEIERANRELSASDSILAADLIPVINESLAYPQSQN